MTGNRVAAALVLVAVALLPAAANDGLDDLLSAFQVTPLGDQRPAPFKLAALDGKPVSLDDLRGRAVMLYFWEST